MLVATVLISRRRSDTATSLGVAKLVKRWRHDQIFRCCRCRRVLVAIAQESSGLPALDAGVRVSASVSLGGLHEVSIRTPRFFCMTLRGSGQCGCAIALLTDVSCRTCARQGAPCVRKPLSRPIVPAVQGRSNKRCWLLALTVLFLASVSPCRFPHPPLLSRALSGAAARQTCGDSQHVACGDVRKLLTRTSCRLRASRRLDTRSCDDGPAGMRQRCSARRAAMLAERDRLRSSRPRCFAPGAVGRPRSTCRHTSLAL